MKTRVNLYTQALRPKSERFTLTQALVASACALLLMSLFIIKSEHENSKLTDKVEFSKTQLTELENEIETLSDKVARHVQNPALDQQLALLKARLQHSDALVSQLGNSAIVQASGFSLLMSDLALLRDKDISLNQIHLAGENMVLTGIARNHDAIPRWINKFSASKSLQGREFSQLKISRNDNDIIAFSLTNKPITGAAKR